MKNMKKRLKGPFKSCEVSISTSSNYFVSQQDSSRLAFASVYFKICHIEGLGQSGAHKLQTCLKDRGFNTKKSKKNYHPQSELVNEMEQFCHTQYLI